MLRLLKPGSGMSLLDVGSGTGHFTRRFSEAGLRVIGLETDPGMLGFARYKHPDLPFLRADARALPFQDASVDFAAAVTSLCCIPSPEAALQELWRVARCGVLLGLLNRNSLLCRRKAGKGGYRGVRWDSLSALRQWGARLDPAPSFERWGTAVFLPDATAFARLLERCLPGHCPWGGFLAVFWGR